MHYLHLLDGPCLWTGRLVLACLAGRLIWFGASVCFAALRDARTMALNGLAHRLPLWRWVFLFPLSVLGLFKSQFCDHWHGIDSRVLRELTGEK